MVKGPISFSRATLPATYSCHTCMVRETNVPLQGRMSIENNGIERFIEPVGYAYLPAREMQKMTCAGQTRCCFYVS
ncbi:MAG TPA: hypothetical protein VK513_02720 [Terriglobales bacterium]|nr:hypothetical protein [Terriglobales bacterium]